MRELLRVLAVGLSTVAAACLHSPPTTMCRTPALAPGARADTAFSLPAPPGTVRGTVVDRETGRPLAVSYVRIPAAARAVKTDSFGHFVVRDVAPGQYQLQAIRIGWIPATRVVTLSTDSGATAVLVQSRDTTAGQCVTVSESPEAGAPHGIARVPSNDTLKPSGAKVREASWLSAGRHSRRRATDATPI